MKFDIKKLVDEALSKDFWYRALIMVVSMFVLAVNYNTFLLPNNFVIGGTSGITTIVHHFTGIEPATFVFIFNAVFIILALFLLGPRQTGLSLIGSLVYPFFVSITSGFCTQIAANLHFDSFILTAIIAAVPSSAVGVESSVPEPVILIVNFSTLFVTSKLVTPIPTALQP